MPIVIDLDRGSLGDLAQRGGVVGMGAAVNVG